MNAIAAEGAGHILRKNYAAAGTHAPGLFWTNLLCSAAPMNFGTILYSLSLVAPSGARYSGFRIEALQVRDDIECVSARVRSTNS